MHIHSTVNSIPEPEEAKEPLYIMYLDEVFRIYIICCDSFDMIYPILFHLTTKTYA